MSPIKEKLNLMKADANLLEVFKGGGFSLIFKIAGIGLGYVFYMLLSRFYGAEIVGIYTICSTILMLGMVLGKVGLDSAIVRFISGAISINRPGDSKIFRLNGLLIVLMASTLVSFLIVVFARQLNALFFDENDYTLFIKIIAFTLIPASTLSYNGECLRGLKKIKPYAFFQNGSVMFLMILFIAAIYFLQLKFELIFVALFASYALLMIFSFGSNYKFYGHIKTDTSIYNPETSYKRILAVSIPMLLTNSLYLVLNWTDILMIGYFKSEDWVGIYNISVKIAALNVIGLNSVNIIAAPKFAELFKKKDMLKLRKLVKQTTLIDMLISIPIVLIIFLFPEFLLKLFGSEFSAGKTALIILTLGQFYHAFAGATLILLNMTGYEKTARNIIIAGSLLNILLNYFLIPPYGITGAAIATASSTIIWKSISVYYIKKNLKFSSFIFRLHETSHEK